MKFISIDNTLIIDRSQKERTYDFKELPHMLYHRKKKRNIKSISFVLKVLLKRSERAKH